MPEFFYYSVDVRDVERPIPLTHTPGDTVNALLYTATLAVLFVGGVLTPDPVACYGLVTVGWVISGWMGARGMRRDELAMARRILPHHEATIFWAGNRNNRLFIFSLVMGPCAFIAAMITTRFFRYGFHY